IASGVIILLVIAWYVDLFLFVHGTCLRCHIVFCLLFRSVVFLIFVVIYLYTTSHFVNQNQSFGGKVFEKPTGFPLDIFYNSISRMGFG
ncbi:hypothetical protein Q4572_23465, partial [Acinetobacter guillouiae]|nr:hypothetical protein [Acinetobacter guillouiae]